MNTKRRQGIERNNIFGRRLQKIRISKGLSQKDLSTRLDVNPQTISRWERGEDIPKVNALQAVAAVLEVTYDFLLDDSDMEYETTQYQKKYQQSGKNFYWGEEIWEVAYEVLRLVPPVRPVKLLDIGCGEGQAAVFFARVGYDVSAFDISVAGLNKGKSLAFSGNVNVKFFHANLLSYEFSENFDVIYARGLLEYVPPKYRKRIMKNIQSHTNIGGLNVFDTFVEKSFIETAPDWEAKKEYYWQTGELFSHYQKNWKLEKMQEIIIDCNSSGTPHKHCYDVMIARKMLDI